MATKTTTLNITIAENTAKATPRKARTTKNKAVAPTTPSAILDAPPTSLEKFMGFAVIPFKDIKCKFHIQNRPVPHDKHFNDIKRLLKINYGGVPPIKINTINGILIDGQHRYIAIKELIDEHELGFTENTLVPIMFVEVDKANEYNVIRLNNNAQKGWYGAQYADGFVRGGHPIYIALKEWCIKHGLYVTPKKFGSGFVEGESTIKYRHALNYIFQSNNQALLQSENLDITKEQFEMADIYFNEWQQVLSACGYADVQGDPNIFGIKPWVDMRQRYSLAKWISAIKKAMKTASIASLPKTTNATWRTFFLNVEDKYLRGK